MTIDEILTKIRVEGAQIHKYHRNGHPRQIYINALMNRMNGIVAVTLSPRYEIKDENGSPLGETGADLQIGPVVVTVKVKPMLMEEDTMSLLGLMRGAGLEHGMLLNFGAYRFQIRKYTLDPRKDKE